MLTKQFNDVEQRVKFATGFCNAQNQIITQVNADQGYVAPQIDVEKVERSIRKQHAKFYGLDSKYDGKGNLRELPYAPLQDKEVAA